VTGLEIASPRGRIAAMRAVQLDGAPMDGAFEDAMEACVQCRGCEAACPSSVPFGHLMEGARAALHDDPPRRPALHRRLAAWLGYRVVLPHHHVLLAFTWLLLVAQRLHLVPHRFGIPRLSARSLARRLRGDADGQVSLFPGCVMDAWQRDVHRSSLAVMRATGARVDVSRGAGCCGALHMHAGRTDEARRLAQEVIDAQPGDALVVVDSAGCGAAMKDYGRLLDTDEARAFAARVRDFSEWLVEVGEPATTAVGTTVVVQDPCHLRHVQGVAGDVRLALAPAYDVREPGDDGLCCGAGGAYAVLEPELSSAIRDRKVAALRAVVSDEALVVVSANPGCSMHLAAAGLDVRHPAQLLEAALAVPGPEDEELRS
jgi:glycolate oxidase iron-sulfur subunit